MDPALLIEPAFRNEILGRGGIFYKGRLRSSAELREMASQPLYPLPPFYYRIRSE